MPRWVLGVVVGPWLLASALRAQGTSVREHLLTVAGGPLFVSQRDANASPLRYGGTAGAFQAGYGVRTGGSWLGISVGGALGRLRSDLTQGNLPREEAWRGWVETEYARVMIATGSQTRWLMGARFAAHGTAIHHYYSDPGASEAGYTFFSAAVGPIVGFERAFSPRTMVSAWVGAPLLALIARPYVGGGFLDQGGALHVRVATLNVFQGPQLTAAYATQIGRGVDLVLGYHVVVEHYRDSQPFRYASQDVSVALRLRLGGTL